MTDLKIELLTYSRRYDLVLIPSVCLVPTVRLSSFRNSEVPHGHSVDLTIDYPKEENTPSLVDERKF